MLWPWILAVEEDGAAGGLGAVEGVLAPGLLAPVLAPLFAPLLVVRCWLWSANLRSSGDPSPIHNRLLLVNRALFPCPCPCPCTVLSRL